GSGRRLRLADRGPRVEAGVLDGPLVALQLVLLLLRRDLALRRERVESQVARHRRRRGGRGLLRQRQRPGCEYEQADQRGSHGHVSFGRVSAAHPSSPCFSISVPTVLASSRMKEPAWVGFVVFDWLAHTSLFCCRL